MMTDRRLFGGQRKRFWGVDVEAEWRDDWFVWAGDIARWRATLLSCAADTGSVAWPPGTRHQRSPAIKLPAAPTGPSYFGGSPWPSPSRRARWRRPVPLERG